MRNVLCLAAALLGMTAALGAGATAARAEGAEPSATSTGGGASATVAAAVLAVPLMPPLDRVELVTRKPIGDDDPFNRLKGAIRHRFASQMMDLYPVEASGFHASFGTRFFKKSYVRRDQEAATNGLLYTPRLPRGALGLRGFPRATPAATFGYTELLRRNLLVGLEGGTLLGRIVQPLPSGRRLAGLPGGARGDRAMQMNPVVNLTLAYAF